MHCEVRTSKFLESHKEGVTVCSVVLAKQHRMLKVFMSAATGAVTVV